MKYLTWKKYSGQDYLGRKIEIPLLAEAETQDNIICWNRIPICLINSQVGREFFVWNDDDRGLIRANLEQDIWFNKEFRPYPYEETVLNEDGDTETRTVIKYTKYSADEARFLKKNFSKYLESGDIINFNNSFYQAPISDLEVMSRYLRPLD